MPREQQHLDKSTYDAIELICTIAFTLELVLHTLAAHSLRGLRRDVFYLLNVLAAAPLYIDLICRTEPGDSNLQPLRLMRLLKLARQYDGARVLVGALQLSFSALCVPLYFCVCGVVVFAGFLWAAEAQSTDDLEEVEEGRFATIPGEARGGGCAER